MPIEAPSHLYSGNAWFVESLYEQYLEDPSSIEAAWRTYFDSLQTDGQQKDIPHTPIQQTYRDTMRRRGTNSSSHHSSHDALAHQQQSAVSRLVNAYRFRGHGQADLDPLRQYQRPAVAELEPEFHGLGAKDMDSSFNTGSLFAPDELPLSEILLIVQQTYCRTIGAEYMHINETEQKRWIQKRLEQSCGDFGFDRKKKRHILKRLIAANTLEQYLHQRYVGQKRFSLEGGEGLIPLLDELVQQAGILSVKEIVIGMAHRGRLNVLVNIVGKKPDELFDEFEGNVATMDFEDIDQIERYSGDVKYHMGYSSDIHTRGGSVHLALAFNPSHLEIIDPVVEGSVRARQDRRGDSQRHTILPVLIHGDAAFAGQGVIMETFNLSQTRGYTTGGTVHVIINNQIGFTTSDPLDSRSSLHCTDVAKMVQAPIFHVNGDDPEALTYIAKLALDFRMTFKKDVVIDMVCFRKHGHSEADEPVATQPVMYKKIKQHPGSRTIYTQKLIDEAVITTEDAEDIEKDYIDSLESNRGVAGTHAEHADPTFLIDYSRFTDTHWTTPVDTRINANAIDRLARNFCSTPDGFQLHPAVERILTTRRKMGGGELPIDWGFAETLAYASLLENGTPVRISGQDSGRGTFFHRHAVLHDQNNGNTWLPLQHLSPDQAPFLVINSTLSEEAVLAFEYGYSGSSPDVLTVWEAQFGDFANGAQVVFDQFISSCEAKWRRYCGLVVLLPHGYDGQGPEHSSARLERYLQLCAKENMQVCFPSTPAQIFHLLRRQMLRAYRKPLIVMSPKSLLRHKLATSTIAELSEGGFQNVIDEIDALDKDRVRRLLACSGKIYYELLEQRRKQDIQDIALIRIEQLFPFPRDEVREIVASYRNLNEIVWVQEEPKNQGSWYYMQSRGTMLGCLQGKSLDYVGRFYSASPACGYMSLHLQQQRQIVEQALDIGA